MPLNILILELGAKGYGCAQILLAGGLRHLGRDNPDLLRAMSGLAQGGGGSGEICGALSGGFCLIGLYCGKGRDGETPDGRAGLLMDGLLSWFRSRPFARGGLTCDAILGKTCSGMDPALCGGIVSGVWETVLTLLLENGIDPGEGREAG
ncbi:MAG: C-GCAxxG-C-C family protein [Desulfovibrio sp.]|jgi:hypothetical protein|nr:C-GCAxxG-C-C family protein [Desulfovibrio sp.]